MKWRPRLFLLWHKAWAWQLAQFAEWLRKEHVASADVYQLASERFINVVKRALFNMTKEGK